MRPAGAFQPTPMARALLRVLLESLERRPTRCTGSKAFIGECGPRKRGRARPRHRPPHDGDVIKERETDRYRRREEGRQERRTAAEAGAADAEEGARRNLRGRHHRGRHPGRALRLRRACWRDPSCVCLCRGREGGRTEGERARRGGVIAFLGLPLSAAPRKGLGSCTTQLALSTTGTVQTEQRHEKGDTLHTGELDQGRTGRARTVAPTPKSSRAATVPHRAVHRRRTNP